MSEAHKEQPSLGYHLHKAFAALTETLNGELRAAGLALTHPHFSLLQAVGRMPGASQAKLARETGKDTAAVSRSLDYLEKRGFLQRSRINGCTKGVFLTARGEELRPLLEEAIRKTVARACAGLAPREGETLIRLLKTITATLHAEPPHTTAPQEGAPTGPPSGRKCGLDLPGAQE